MMPFRSGTGARFSATTERIIFFESIKFEIVSFSRFPFKNLIYKSFQHYLIHFSIGINQSTYCTDAGIMLFQDSLKHSNFEKNRILEEKSKFQNLPELSVASSALAGAFQDCC